eukprot:647514-Pelagomonas_calceolata.AAC.1
MMHVLLWIQVLLSELVKSAEAICGYVRVFVSERSSYCSQLGSSYGAGNTRVTRVTREKGLSQDV